MLWLYGTVVALLLYWGFERLRKRRQRTAELRRELQRMESRKLESLSTLAGGVAHDFNNLLVGIFGYAELARLEVEPGSAAAGYLDRIEESADRAAELSRQMLFYSGRGTFTVKPLSLSELVRDTVQDLKPGLGSDVSILLELERHIPAIEGDEAQLKQLVRNLVLNAAEALGQKPGIIVLSTGFMVSGASAEGESVGSRVFLTVDDTGRGIGPEEIERIFDPFFSTKSPGRGLGLAVTQGIVRGHGATLKVSSTPGRGSTFRVLFPAAGRLDSKEPARDLSAEPFRAEGKALIIDDERTVRAVAERFLERLGFETLEAESGERGIEIYRRDHAEIGWVLVDISMPGIDGIETARRLREIDPSVAILMSSGFSQEEVLQGIENPADGFIEKPYRLSDLEQALRSLAKRSPNVRRSAPQALRK